MGATTKLVLSQDAEADQLLSDSPLALLIGMVLDQQIPLERAFRSPYDLKERMGGSLDVRAIADHDPDDLARLFKQPPALHRFPAANAKRVQELCRLLIDNYDGDAERVWTSAPTGADLYRNIKELPGFGEQKARIFTALLAKRFGVRPPGWEEAAGEYGAAGVYKSVADIEGPESLAKVRAYKQEMKAAAKSKAK